MEMDQEDDSVHGQDPSGIVVKVELAEEDDTEFHDHSHEAEVSSPGLSGIVVKVELAEEDDTEFHDHSQEAEDKASTSGNIVTVKIEPDTEDNAFFTQRGYSSVPATDFLVKAKQMPSSPGEKEGFDEPPATISRENGSGGDQSQGTEYWPREATRPYGGGYISENGPYQSLSDDKKAVQINGGISSPPMNISRNFTDSPMYMQPPSLRNLLTNGRDPSTIIPNSSTYAKGAHMKIPVPMVTACGSGMSTPNSSMNVQDLFLNILDPSPAEGSLVNSHIPGSTRDSIISDQILARNAHLQTDHSVDASNSYVNAYCPTLDTRDTLMNVHPSTKQFVNDSTSAANAHPPAFNTHDLSVSADNSSSNVHPPNINTHGPSVNAFYSSANAYSQSVNIHAPSVDTHNSSANAPLSSVNAHTSTINMDGTSANAPNPSANAYPSAQGVKKAYPCEYCEKVFSFKSVLRNHLMFHNNVRPYKCETCQKSFTRAFDLKKHERIHTGQRPYLCSYCGRTFVSSSNYVIHIRIHTGERPYKCRYCVKTFRDASSTTVHERIHTGYKPHKCEICEKAFVQLCALKSHRLTHHKGDVKKDYVCVHCQQAFATKGSMQEHVSIHTGERPHQCEQCDQTFRVISGLRNHKRRVHSDEKPHRCPYCEKGFKFTDDLKYHERGHTGEKPFKCGICDMAYARSGSLRKHERKHLKATPT